MHSGLGHTVVAVDPVTRRLDVVDRQDADPRAVWAADRDRARARSWSRWFTRPAAADPEYRPSLIARGVLWCGGVDRDLLTTRGEYYRFVNVGLFVLLVAAMAGVSFTMYITAILGGFAWWYLPPAVFWAMVIFTLDRTIVAEPSYGDLSLAALNRQRAAREAGRPDDDTGPVGIVAPRASWWVRLHVYRRLTFGFRILISLLIAGLIGEAVLLAVFRPEIDAQLATQNAAAFDTAATAAENRITASINLLGHQYAEDGWAGKLKSLREKVNRLDNAKTDPSAPDPSALVALRPVLQNAEDHEDEYVRLKENLQDQIAAIHSRDPARIAKFDPDLGALLERHPVAGWVEQETALHRYLGSAAVDPYLWLIPWMVRGILFSIDMLPLMLKIATSSTIYGNRQRDGAGVIRYADAVAVDTRRDEIDRKSLLFDKRSQVAFEALSQREDDWLLRRRGLLREQRSPGGS